MKLVDWILRRHRDDDLREEIRAHLSMATQDRVDDGEDVRTARLASLKEFGNVTLTREATRLTWGGLWIERLANMARDIGYGLRLLRRSPAYSSVVVAVLAVGIACNVIAFSLFKAVALAPLAGVDDSGSLQFVGATTSSGELVPLSYPDYQDLRGHAFPRLAAWAIQPLILGQGASGRLVSAEFVTGNYFDVLGVRVQRGRTLLPSDEIEPGGHPVVIIADGIWRRAFGADPQMSGRRFRSMPIR